MLNRLSPRLAALAAIVCCCVLSLAGCTPHYDWREVRGSDAPFTVLLPAKPAHFSRPVNLDGMTVTMTMTAAEVDGVTFAVGSAELKDAAQAPRALKAMQTALVNNIHGSLQQQKSVSEGGRSAIRIRALGSAGRDGQARLLVAHFVAQERHIYQVLALGPPNRLTEDAIDMFFSSFKAS
jgi:hypothetical protein